MLAVDFPWPADTGHRQRLALHLRALARLGEVHLFSVLPPGRAEPCKLPQDAPISAFASVTRRARGSATVVPRALARTSPRLGSTLARSGRTLSRAWHLASSNMPADLPATNAGELRAALYDFVTPPYDLVWCSRPEAFVDLGFPRLGRTIVDMEDLEHLKLRALARVHFQRAASRAADRAANAPPPATLADFARALAATLSARRFEVLLGRVLSEAKLVVACSEEDASGLEALSPSNPPPAVVVPNGYPLPREPAGRPGILHDPSHTLPPPTVLAAAGQLSPVRVPSPSSAPRARPATFLSHALPRSSARLFLLPEPCSRSTPTRRSSGGSRHQKRDAPVHIPASPRISLPYGYRAKCRVPTWWPPAPAACSW